MRAIARRTALAALLVVLTLSSSHVAGFGAEHDPSVAGDAAAATYETAFDAFARQHAASDTPPAAVVGALQGPAGATAGSRARLLNAGTPRVHLARTDDGACVAVELGEGASAACTKDANLLQGKKPPIGVLATGDGRWRVVGVLPNGTTDVRLHLAAGSSVPLALDGNVVSRVFDDPPASLTWTSPDGTGESHELPDPEGVKIG